MSQSPFSPQTGIAEILAPDLRRVLAPNPSPMTWLGTNTYLLGTKDIAVIDPGPNLPAHMDAILSALVPSQRITHIVVTHSHVDHSPLARPLSEHTGAPVLAFGDSQSGRSAAMQACLDAGLKSGGEGIDQDFSPDILLTDNQSFTAGDQTLTALHTPGHMGNHMCFEWNDQLFCGDLVMGWASSLVSPPDGDLTDFMASCRRLLTRNITSMHSGHGAPISAPHDRLEWLITHRLSREAQILEHLTLAPAHANALARAIYTETPPALLPAATRNVFAHLIDLLGKNVIATEDTPSETALFHRV